MKSIIAAILTFACVLTRTLVAEVPEQAFKAGAYRGMMTVTASIEGIGATTSTLKLIGRSGGNSTLRMMSVPDLGQLTLAGENHYPVKIFGFKYEAFFSSMVLVESNNIAPGPEGNATRPLESLIVKGNTIRATAVYDRMLGTDTVTFTVKVVLTRTGK
jgi:hypothetical protein